MPLHYIRSWCHAIVMLYSETHAPPSRLICHYACLHVRYRNSLKMIVTNTLVHVVRAGPKEKGEGYSRYKFPVSGSFKMTAPSPVF